LQYFFVNLII